MSDSAFSFDATTVEPSSPLETIPSGWYRAMITSSELKPTKSNTGKYIEFTWKVIDGEYEGRIVWDRLNVINPNDTAREIAERALSALCHAVGVLKFKHHGELLHRPALIKVTVKQDKGYEASNEVKGYKAVDEAAYAKAAPTARPATPRSPSTGDDDLPF